MICLFFSVSSHGEAGVKYVIVRLIVRGNESLQKICHTAEQKEIWWFLLYEFMMREDFICVVQIQSACPSYVNALLTMSCDISQARICERNNDMVFADHI